MIKTRDALKLIAQRRGDAVVITTMMGSRGWRDVTGGDSPLDMPLRGAMSKGPSLALGFGMAMPDRKVIVIDGDGSLLMNLGALVTAAGQSPANLYHFVLENGMYAVTGGQPVPNAHGFSFAGMAQAAGYRSAYEFDDLEDFATRVDEIMGQPGPVLVCLRVEPEIENTPIRMRTRSGRTMAQILADMRQALQTGSE